MASPMKTSTATLGIVFPPRMGEHFGDLSMAAAAIDALHQRAEPPGLGNPGRGAAFRKAAIIDELDVEPAGGSRFAKHIGLQPAGAVPGRLPAHGGIERENQPAALTGLDRRAERFDALQEFDRSPRVRMLAGGSPGLTRWRRRAVGRSLLIGG